MRAGTTGLPSSKCKYIYIYTPTHTHQYLKCVPNNILKIPQYFNCHKEVKEKEMVCWSMICGPPLKAEKESKKLFNIYVLTNQNHKIFL